MSLHIIEPAVAAPVPVRRQVLVFGSPLWRLSTSTPAGILVCLICAARTKHVVRSTAERVLKPAGYSAFVVGRYLGADPPKPTTRRTQRARNG